ncbi:putative acyltransferase [Bacteroides zoogleoformans]|uniref:DUF5009 domain-containing protein n=1 Tax=Bacteroides zoogleoformans TaxID=28119 RepID=A0ABM6T9B2_9BACE|nr:DUF5009 domain-containing protein [Bacteroides zoogleoformans]AVM53231.1 DUF5009 domain-containing protein [Bacteroides zoogleoformans]TWJ17831.1 putative acyltransferase [Bacteroides zoogleoformans]
MNTPASRRILALDVFRGVTIAGMILVNDPGSWSYIYVPLRHAEWIGLTPTDLVFPFFMFIMGISIFISLKKYDFKWSGEVAKKVIKRTLLLYLVGFGLNWITLSFKTWHSLYDQNLSFLTHFFQSITNFEHIRISGVIPYLAVNYGITALFVLTVKHKHIPYLIISLLLTYALILFFGNGFTHNETNITSIIDRKIMGINHMYNDNGIEPESIISILSSVAHVLIGFVAGRKMFEAKELCDKVQRLFIMGVILTFAGFLISYASPICKKVWSSSFTIVSCGFGTSLTALLIWIIDIKGYRKWTVFFETFGVNPLLMYLMSMTLATILGGIRFYVGDKSINVVRYIYANLLQPVFGNYGGSLMYAILFTLLIWSLGYRLYKRKIYIKL